MVIRQKLEFSKLKLNGSRSVSYFIGTSLDVTGLWEYAEILFPYIYDTFKRAFVLPSLQVT